MRALPGFEKALGLFDAFLDDLVIADRQCACGSGRFHGFFVRSGGCPAPAVSSTTMSAFIGGAIVSLMSSLTPSKNLFTMGAAMRPPETRSCGRPS